MKNDLDFIRDKIENSGVRVPEDMNEDYVLSQLDGVQPKPAALPPQLQQPQKPKKNGWKIALSAAAAALVIAIGVGAAVNVFHGKLPGIRNLIGGNSIEKTDQLPGGLALKRFGDRTDIVKTVKQIKADRERMTIGDYLEYGGKMLFDDRRDAMDYAVEDADSLNSGYAADALTGSASSGSQAHSDTYIQVEGVDEADVIKTDGRYIYCVDSYYSNKVAIFSAEGENARLVAEINVNQQKAATGDEVSPDHKTDFDYESYYGYGAVIDNIYLSDNRLVVLCDDYRDGQLTIAQVYDVIDIDNITLIGTNTQSGYCRSSRMIGDTLYTVSSYTPYDDRYIPLCYDGEDSEEIPADCIYALDEPESENFLVLSAYNIADNAAEETMSKAILGAVDDIYCNLNHMYIYTTHRDYGDTPWYVGLHDVITGEESGSDVTVTTQILKVDLTDGISFTAYAEVNGIVDDQYALDEYDGNLRVATTVSGAGSKRDDNCLYVLDENLGKLGEVTGFALDESIKAVRYMGDTAYVITYEQTDPLFVIDLSAPTAPAILGEVKISGFSTMLVPVGDDMLLGIGYHTENEDYTDLEVQEGLKLALFDVSDKSNPQVLDSISYVDCSSAVQYDPKALVYNPKRDDYVIPLNYYHADYEWWDSVAGYGSYGETEAYGGMLNFKVEDGKLQEISRYAADYEEDVERCVYVGDTVYMTHYADYDTLRLDSVPYR